MEISMGFAEALVRFAHVQKHPAEISDADRQNTARELATIVREEGPLNIMLRAERVRRYGWHPTD
jgi:hypothetical protein